MIRVLSLSSALLIPLLLSTTACADNGAEPPPEVVEPAVEPEPYASGLDVLVALDFAPLAGRRVGLVTNSAARDAGERPIWELLHEAADVELVRLYTPEHGLGADLEGSIADAVEPRTRLPIRSLYGGRRAPDPAELAGLDTLLYDLPDVGVRFYTYTSTLYLCLEACREAGIPLTVLDRPCPLGDTVAGTLPPGLGDAFVGLVPLPVRYGLTPGELARWIAGELLPGVVVDVILMAGYDPGAYYDELRPAPPWRPTSPNLPVLGGVLCYPGTGLFEPTTLSVGRGTATPFEVVGAPWLDAEALAAHWEENCPGALYEVVEFTPRAPSDSRHDGRLCRGVRIVITDRDVFEPVKLALWGYDFLGRRHPTETRLQPRFLARMLGTDDLARVFHRTLDPAALWERMLEEAAVFEAGANPYRLYETPAVTAAPSGHPQDSR